MSKNKSLLDRKMSLRSMGNLLGGSVVAAVVAGVFWHRRAIKRLIEIRLM